jgi:ABC-type transport system involved in multi-copper enzyme maturation permease subunit
VGEVAVIAGYALRESMRRKVFLIVLLLSVAFLVLYGVGVWRAFEDTAGFVPPDQLGLDSTVVTGATVLGLAMFATLFLGTVLAIFLTLGVVRGDAERGLLQPLVVRPVGRSTLLLSRFLAAAGVCVLYVAVLFTIETVTVGLIGGWWPDNAVAAGAELAFAVVIVVALSLLGSIFLTATTNGIAVFMVFGGGLVAGLLAQIGRAIGSETLRSIGRWASYVLPFEALYQDALHVLTSGTTGFERFALELGPFGGSSGGGVGVVLWGAAYLVLVGAAGIAAFGRRDLP